jgi:hypothetical protein
VEALNDVDFELNKFTPPDVQSNDFVDGANIEGQVQVWYPYTSDACFGFFSWSFQLQLSVMDLNC